MTNQVRYSSETGRHPSPNIFPSFGKLRDDAARGECIWHFDDFGVTTAHASVSASGGYYTLQESSGTFLGVRTVADIGDALGELQLAGSSTDTAENHISFSGDALPIRVDNGAGNTGEVGFEIRIATNTVANTRTNWFVGLAGPIIAAGHIVDAGTLIAAGSAIGFQAFEDDGNQMDTLYQAISQTQAEVEANAVTLVADTFVNLGLRYRPSNSDATQITFYVNGVNRSTYITRANMDAATFPEGEALAPVLLTNLAAGTEAQWNIDWVGWYQYFDEGSG